MALKHSHATCTHACLCLASSQEIPYKKSHVLRHDMNTILPLKTYVQYVVAASLPVSHCRSFQSAILNRFGNVIRSQPRFAAEVCDRARNFEHAMVAACRQSQPTNSVAEKIGTGTICHAVLVELACSQSRVRYPLTRKLQCTGLCNATNDGGRCLSRCSGRQLFRWHGGHLERQVDSVEKWPGDT